MFTYDSILQEIIPENDSDVLTSILDKINACVKHLKVQVFLGGSQAKNTHLKGSSDVDVFVRFDYVIYQDKDISSLLYDALRPLSITKVHGSRDYFQCTLFSYAIEIIPVLHITHPSQAKNITDCSPLHVEWVQKHADITLCNDIRLAKQFCKSAKVYGAESYIQGFSGHIVDILVIFFGGFEKMLHSLAHAKHMIVVDPHTQTYKENLKLKEVIEMSGINPSKLDAPLIVIDPISLDRNASAALSFDVFLSFQKRAQEYLASPSKKFFIIEPLDIQLVSQKYVRAVLLTFFMHDNKKDILGSKMKKALEQVSFQLKEHGFTFSLFWEYEHSSLSGKALFCSMQKSIDASYEIRGPPLNQKEDVERFYEKHAQTFIKEERVYAHEKREYVTLFDAIKHFLYFDKEKIKDVSISLV